MRQLNFIDLFAGAGGLSEGFIRAGFRALAHVEMDANACDTLRTRIVFHDTCRSKKGKKTYEKYLAGGITREELYSTIDQRRFDSVINQEISEETIPGIFNIIDELKAGEEVDVVVGGPPCQAYSLVGRARDPEGMKNDKRNYLFKYYAEFLNRYKPKFFVFENVLGLLSAGNSCYFQEMKVLFEKYGYSVDFDVLNSEDYGVLQNAGGW
jgi:DNA (cytosine-5)-methyltransferase 1